jgi:hypothetical protein
MAYNIAVLLCSCSVLNIPKLVGYSIKILHITFGRLGNAIPKVLSTRRFMLSFTVSYFGRLLFGGAPIASCAIVRSSVASIPCKVSIRRKSEGCFTITAPLPSPPLPSPPLNEIALISARWEFGDLGIRRNGNSANCEFGEMGNSAKWHVTKLKSHDVKLGQFQSELRTTIPQH